MARSFAEIVSIRRLKLWASADSQNDGRPILARRILEAMESGNPALAEQVFLECLSAYFYNLTATEKRRHADSLNRAGYPKKRREVVPPPAIHVRLSKVDELEDTPC